MCYCTPEIRTPCCGGKCHAFLGHTAETCPWHKVDAAYPKAKDWAIEAAVDIIDHAKTGTTLEWVAERIHAHCPMKPSVAYMPVPRCETCAHWKPARDGFGWCGIKREKIQTTPGANLVTAVDFGCTEWKAKL